MQEVLELLFRSGFKGLRVFDLQGPCVVVAAFVLRVVLSACSGNYIAWCMVVYSVVQDLVLLETLSPEL